nr:protein dopey [Quercus suber]
MSLEPRASLRSGSPIRSSGRSTPVPRESRRAVEDGLIKADKNLRRYGTIVERVLQSWETSPQEWADYIAFLTRLSKVYCRLFTCTFYFEHAVTRYIGPPDSSCRCKDTTTWGRCRLEVGTVSRSSLAFRCPPEDVGRLWLYIFDFRCLSTVLSFASLSVRPSLYTLFEEHINGLEKEILRPALKSIILSLLPAIEEETSDDFERAFNILEGLESKFIPNDVEGHSQNKDGYFWQCFFLGGITSPSRRVGALNYLTRRLPKFTGNQILPDTDERVSSDGSKWVLTSEAESVIAPEPGLLIRCFVSGLSDHQMLIQRGFLDLLVSHLPLDSPVLQERVDKRDMDILVSAAVSVLTRRDMSLNRRLWSWFLGPDPKETISEVPDPPSDWDRRSDANSGQQAQLRYFLKNGQKALERCILAMLSHHTGRAIDVAKPFRICLSLMDRWEIGGSLISKIFLPAMRSAFDYCRSATVSDTKDVLRSVSLFFDGVEAHLIYAELNQLLLNDEPDAQIANLALFAWIIEHFNLRDEDMLTIHIPVSLMHLLSILQDHAAFSSRSFGIALGIASHLTELLPSWLFSNTHDTASNGSKPSKQQQKVWSGEDIKLATLKYYGAQEPGDPRSVLPLESAVLTHTLLSRFSALAQFAMVRPTGDTLSRLVSIITGLLQKLPSGDPIGSGELFRVMYDLSLTARQQDSNIQFPVVGAIINLAHALYGSGRLSMPHLLQLEPNLTEFLWNSLSPFRPKYHLEAVKSIWQFENLTAAEGKLQISLLGLLCGTRVASGQTSHVDEETASRFAVLWNHTLAAQPNSHRRNSNTTNVNGPEQIERHRTILIEPLLVVLDTLHLNTGPGFDVVRRWLLGLPSLEHVFKVLLARMHRFSQASSCAPDSHIQVRDDKNQSEELEYVFKCFHNILANGNSWTWQCLSSARNGTAQPQELDGLLQLAQTCTNIISGPVDCAKALDEAALRVLSTLFSGPTAQDLRFLDVESLLLDRLTDSVAGNVITNQVQSLRLITAAIELKHGISKPQPPNDGPPISTPDPKRPSTSASVANDNASGPVITDALLAKILRCLCAGFSSHASRRTMDQWLIFLADVLPTFASAIFSSLIPLVECFCSELDKEFNSLVDLSSPNASLSCFSPEAAIASLLDGLEMILARANDCLLNQPETEAIKQQSVQSSTFLGNVTSGMFKVDGPVSRSAQSNSRLTVTLAFQDAIRISLKIWSWATRSIDGGSIDRSCVATTAYSALRVRNKTRQLLEHIFAVEPLEGLEVVMAQWCHPIQAQDAATALNIVHVMQASRPKNVIPAILDALCSRANISALPTQRQSSLTIDITALDTSLFYAAYLESLEDDAMDEIWVDCVNFLRDVVANPMPYRQILPTLLSIVQLLARKVDNTNFGEQKRMRRDLGDVFQRLLSATFATLPGAVVSEPAGTQAVSRQPDALRSTDLFVVLAKVISSLDIIVDSSDRANAIINSISTSLINPMMHAKSFPRNMSPDTLAVVLEMASKAPTAKSWKKDLTDAFNDSKMLGSTLTMMEDGWLPAFKHLFLRDKERFTELLSRMPAPSTAGIMFGVGASAARLEADRKTQLNLRRICIALLSTPEDTFVSNLREIQEKLVELFDAGLASSPSAIIKAELFMLCRALLLSHSTIHLSLFWPIINDKLQSAMMSLLPGSPETSTLTNFSLLQACKLLDQLVALSLDDFQLYQWLYITDTVDAVWRPSEHSSFGLTELVAEALTTPAGSEDNVSPVMFSLPSTSKTGKRRPILIDGLSIDKGDLRALAREDFVRAVIRPFLSQLSMFAYEGVYSMAIPDVDACRRDLLEDVLEQSTLVE